jgi:hypothetical protein
VLHDFCAGVGGFSPARHPEQMPYNSVVADFWRISEHDNAIEAHATAAWRFSTMAEAYRIFVWFKQRPFKMNV